MTLTNPAILLNKMLELRFRIPPVIVMTAAKNFLQPCNLENELMVQECSLCGMDKKHAVNPSN